MYHYLKWAALGLFFRRNLRYLVLMGVGFVGIFVADAVYEDMADFAAKAGRTESIATYLMLKWAAVAFFAGLILFAATRLGFASEPRKGGAKEKKAPPEPNDPIMKRLEKFKTPKRLRHRADLVIEKRKRNR
ncbi:hypothetical protein [Hydrogenimonas sp.]